MFVNLDLYFSCSSVKGLNLFLCYVHEKQPYTMYGCHPGFLIPMSKAYIVVLKNGLRYVCSIQFQMLSYCFVSSITIQVPPLFHPITKSSKHRTKASGFQSGCHAENLTDIYFHGILICKGHSIPFICRSGASNQHPNHLTFSSKTGL